jgi:hypothetical protein
MTATVCVVCPLALGALYADTGWHISSAAAMASPVKIFVFMFIAVL